MMKKVWDYMIKRFKDDVGVRDYLQAVLSNLVAFFIISIFMLGLVSFMAR